VKADEAQKRLSKHGLAESTQRQMTPKERVRFRIEDAKRHDVDIVCLDMADAESLLQPPPQQGVTLPPQPQGQVLVPVEAAGGMSEQRKALRDSVIQAALDLLAADQRQVEHWESAGRPCGPLCAECHRLLEERAEVEDRLLDAAEALQRDGAVQEDEPDV